MEGNDVGTSEKLLLGDIFYLESFNGIGIVGEYLQRHQNERVQVMGYDVVHKNADCVRRGAISFLIAQHGFMQGFKAVDALFRSLVLKEDIRPVNFMPIELLSMENIDFYQRSTI